MKEQIISDKKVVVIGGGAGSSSLLNDFKYYTKNISALISMVDDGGSTGRLRDSLGVLPPGDIRKNLVALSNAPDELRRLFEYRFTEGELRGHAFGNIFLSATEKMTHNFNDAVRLASEVLEVSGAVIPITLENTRLVAKCGNEQIFKGEDRINEVIFQDKSLPRLYLEPEARINPAAADAIQDAELIIIAPGDIYTSIGPSLIVKGVSEALAAAKAPIVYVCNIMSKTGHTTGYTVAAHAAEVERFAGMNILDYVLYNTAKPPDEILHNYMKAGEDLVVADQKEFESTNYVAMGRPLILSRAPIIILGDALAQQRSYIRHDGNLVAQALLYLDLKV